ncbi:methyltransferase N6AMT1-like isoform X1 [Brassica rapa]|uniref:Methyltransferase small domain-containing protein n=2 Tax=Brassica campestris TaxID=3711 RepID=M4FE81_BRACM|nr:methyltransferase N6AMT1-like isoform X1 [Brassica rapa]XP_033143254.1 methyltransferase N6AMT1-like isoform X1 [Brassica rapa]
MEDLIILYNLLLHTLLFHSAVAVAVAVSVASLFGEIYPPRSFRRLPKTLFLTLTLNLQWTVMSEMTSRTADILRVSSHREVYEPCDDSFALVDALLADQTNLINHDPKVCMEIGCGSGYVITSLILLLKEKLPNVHYIATDTNQIAARVTNETLQAHGVSAEVVCTDIASCLEKRLAGLVDVMVVNPPYVPTPEYEVGMEGIASAWAGGENGRSVIDRVLPVVDRLLSEKGWFYLVTLTSNYPSEICLGMRKRGYASRIVVQRSTEEENLIILKFWRDKDEEGVDKETSSESFVKQFSRSLSSFMEKQWR